LCFGPVLARTLYIPPSHIRDIGMPRIRIDQHSKNLLEELSEQYEGSQKGLASEFIRDGAGEMLQQLEDNE